MKNNLIVIVIVGALFFASCSKAQQTGEVLAEVNGSILTYEYLMDQFPEEYRNSITKDQIAKAVDVWIETELLYQEALKNSIDKESRIKNLIEQKRKDIIASRYVDEYITSDQQPTQAQMDSAYQANKDMYTAQEDMYLLKHIVLSSKGGADAVYGRLVKGEDFDALVKDYSEDEQSRKQGGEIGLLAESGLEPAIVAALKPLSPGQYSKPVKSQSGYYHIFMVEDKIKAGTVPVLEDIKSEVSDAILAAKQQVSYSHLVDSLAGKANIKRNPINVPIK
jgi:foldase protein PrsA